MVFDDEHVLGRVSHFVHLFLSFGAEAQREKRNGENRKEEAYVHHCIAGVRAMHRLGAILIISRSEVKSSII